MTAAAGGLSPSLAVDGAFAGLAILAAGLAQVTVPAAMAFGRRFGIVDAVRPDKIHETPRVRCGGIGIYLAFAGGLALALAGVAAARAVPALAAMLPGPLAALTGNVGFVSGKLAAVLGGATFLFLVGLADDRFNLPPLPKLLLQIASAAPLVLAGVAIQGFLPGWLPGALMTVAWVVLLTNAFNFLDNMDGATAGVAAVCAFNFYLVSRGGGEFFMMAVFALLAGAAVGFLRFNFARDGARVFMGDCGSLFLGYMMAALSTLVTYYEAGVPTQLPVVAPLVVLGVPVFDTASVLYIRWRRGAPLMRGDQNHFAHRLVALGFGRRQAVPFIWLVTLAVGLGAANLRTLPLSGAAVALAQVVLFFWIIWLLERVAARKAEGAA